MIVLLLISKKQFLDFYTFKRGKDFRISADSKSVIEVNKRLVAKVYNINSENGIEEIDLLERIKIF